VIGGYFQDTADAARHRAARVALTTTRHPYRRLTRLSRRNARVWRVAWSPTRSRVVKLACGRTPQEVRVAAAWTGREVAVVGALHDAGLVGHRILDFGSEFSVAAPTWWVADDIPGCRASLLVRNACPSDSDVLDVCARTVRAVARHHAADPAVVGHISAADRELLDRPGYGAPPPEAAAVLAELARARASAPRLVACHGDLSLHNVLVSAGGVALVDWACARTDTPGLDLAPVFVWLARYTADPGAGQLLLAVVDEVYGGVGVDPFAGLGPHIARSLLSWAGRHGDRYTAAALRVASCARPDEAVGVLGTQLRSIRGIGEGRT
jgi:hypothetical protein